MGFPGMEGMEGMEGMKEQQELEKIEGEQKTGVPSPNIVIRCTQHVIGFWVELKNNPTKECLSIIPYASPLLQPIGHNHCNNTRGFINIQNYTGNYRQQQFFAVRLINDVNIITARS